MTTANIITYLDQITTEGLISVLTQSETLTCGTVQAFTFDIEQGNWSTSVNLTTTYTDNGQETLPLTPLPQNGGYWYGLKKGFRGRLPFTSHR